MKINLVLSQRGVQDAIQQVRDFKNRLNERTDEFIRRLADIGLDVAQVRFANAEYAGENDVVCRIEYGTHSATIYAEGNAVAFIEFGTGVVYSEHPSGLYAHGTYGQGKGANPKGWAYKGQQGTSGTPIPDRPDVYRTKGNPPAMAMWEASAEMAARVTEIWKEVMQSG